MEEIAIQLIGTGITSFVAFLAILVNIYNTKKTLKANVVSSARIKWIQEVRQRSVEFMTTCYDLIECIRLKNYDINRIISLRSKLKKNGSLLILYFGPDSDKSKDRNNDFVVYLVHLIVTKLVDQVEYYDDNHLIGMIDVIRVLEDFLRIYFKAEWKRANGELKDKKVQDYMEKDELYKRIMEIHKNGFEAEDEWNKCFYDILEKQYKE